MAQAGSGGRETQPDRALVHGSVTGYCHGGCRCDACRLANTDYHRELRKRLRARIGSTLARVPHGTAGGYANHGCRCEACRSAHHTTMAAAYARRRARRLDASKFTLSGEQSGEATR